MAEPSNVVSIDAPIGGWNAYDSLDNMPPDCAVILENLIPRAGTVETRLGTLTYGDTETGLPVETVASLDADIGSLLVVASAGGVWSMSDAPVTVRAGATDLIKAAGTFANSRWQTRNFRKLDEEGVLIMCNGEDPVQIFEEPYGPINLVPAGFAYVDANDETIPGPDTPFIGVEKFKGRCYYWADNDDAFWYTAAGSYKGNVQKFNLGAIAKLGGKITLITTWTQQDSGDGKDDFIVFVMSTGEIIVYQGDDPESEGFFEQVGRYVTAEPLSIRGVDQYGSDTILMTKDGYIALSTIVQEGRVSDVPAFSLLISSAITDKTRFNADYFGWEGTLFAKQSLMLFNVPNLPDGSQCEQHVMNTVTRKWCRFVDINVSCSTVHKDRLFGGAFDGTVLAMLEGTSDLGGAINFIALPAFNYFGVPGNNKFISACQVITTHSNPELIELTGFSNFNFQVPPPITVPILKESAVWSVDPAEPPQAVGSFWDEDYWAIVASPFTTKGWQNVSAYGYAVSVMVRFSKLNDSVIWRSTGIRFNPAGSQ
jgi:hypothetical protein